MRIRRISTQMNTDKFQRVFNQESHESASAEVKRVLNFLIEKTHIPSLRFLFSASRFTYARLHCLSIELRPAKYRSATEQVFHQPVCARL